jgi:hypothetical protein
MRPALARIAALAIAPTLVVFGCRPDTAGGDDPIAPDTYVAVMAELADLRRFPPPGDDRSDRDARTDSMRVEILRAHGVTPEELLAFAEHVGPDPERMEALTERIATLTDSLAGLRDTATVNDPEDLPSPGVGVATSDTAASLPVEESPPDREQALPRSLRDRLDSLRAARPRKTG